MRAQIERWGNSLAVRIPEQLARSGGLDDGTEVELLLAGSALTVTPLADLPLTLAELVSQITPENTHAEFDWGE